jgi:cytochrome P450 family 628
MSAHPKNRSLFSMSDIKDHAARRRIWEPAFTTKALTDFQSNIDALLEEIVGNLDKFAETGASIDMGVWSKLYSLDGES